MANKCTLKILSRTTAGKDLTTNIGYCNPNATDGELKKTAQLLNGLTTNTFRGAVKVTEVDITAAVVFPYYVNPEMTDVTMDSPSKGIFLENDIPTSETVTWTTAVSADNVLNVQIQRDTQGTDRFILLLVKQSGAQSGQTYQVTATPKISDNQVADSVTINVTIG